MEIPWNIPESWKWTTLGEICHIVSGGTPPTNRPDYFGGSIPWITPADLSEFDGIYLSKGSRSLTVAGLENSNAQILPPGSVLFSSRAPIGYVAIAKVPVSTSQGFKNFVFGQDLESEYLFFYLQRAKQIAVRLASGTTFPELSSKQAAKLAVPVAPAAEQRRIVAEIEKQFSRLSSATSALREVGINVNRYSHSLLSQAEKGQLVTGDFEADGTGTELLQEVLNIRSSERLFSSSAGQTLAGSEKGYPGHWATARLSDIADVIDPNPSHRNPRYVKTGFPFLSTAQFAQSEGFDLRTAKFVTEDVVEAQERRCKFSKGSIAFSRKGTVGKTRFLPTTFRFGLLDSLCVINPDGRLCPEFVNFALNMPMVQKQIAVQTRGIALKQISVGDVRKLIVPIPPLPEQIAIAAELDRRLSVIASVKLTIQSYSDRSNSLRSSILEYAFSGKLLRSEFQIEPADALIQRLTTWAAERANIPRAPKKHFVKAMQPAQLKSISELVLHLEKLGGSSKLEELLISSGLADDVDAFYDLLRSARDSGSVVVPSGTINGNVRLAGEN